jgi:hypothetical protein
VLLAKQQDNEFHGIVNKEKSKESFDIFTTVDKRGKPLPPRHVIVSMATYWFIILKSMLIEVIAVITSFNIIVRGLFPFGITTAFKGYPKTTTNKTRHKGETNEHR